MARDTGGERAPLSGALSGYDGRAGLFAWEETANVTLVAGLRRWWESKQTQAKMARTLNLSGYYRAFIGSWDGKPRVVVMPYLDWAAWVTAAQDMDEPA